jgi:tetratricopeptide (TPR) repeat protein
MRFRLFFISFAFSLGAVAIAAPPSIKDAEKLAKLSQYNEAIATLFKIVNDKKQTPAIQEEALQKIFMYRKEQSEKKPENNQLTYLKTFKEDFQSLLLLRPDDGKLYYNYGILLKQLGESTLSIDAFQRALYLGYRNAASNLGRLYFEHKEYEEAIATLQIALELNLSSSQLWLYLGLSQYSLNDFEAAAVSLGKAYELSIISIDYNLGLQSNDLLYIRYSETLLKIGKYQEAIVIAKKYLKFYNDVEGYLFVASVYSSANQPENAIFYYARALDDATNKAEVQPFLLSRVLNNYAWFFCTTQDKKYQSPEYLMKAFQMATKAVASSKRLHTYLDTLAEVYYLLGYPEQAIALEQEAAKKSPSNAFYREQLAKYELALEERPSILVDPEALLPTLGTLFLEERGNSTQPQVQPITP